ncbi:SUMF1/EgtB/PvdO family nonheme iron enzyme [Dethiosulfatarculus sandiegensis]|uniref:SUMF1/EgtB/PvdO family nonheme iron enzyme n=1 Tax=Dethiosulfatarculus sandiegensis TaxID=1429043 RepID=UPI00338F05A0
MPLTGTHIGFANVYSKKPCLNGTRLRTTLGGSWNNTAENARCANRNNNNPDNRNNNVGFRCARTL